MAETIGKRFGRTNHDIWLLTMMRIEPIQQGQTPFPIGSDEEAGFIAQRLTTYKNLIRTVFRTDTTSTTFNIGKRGFSVQSSHGFINVPPGIVTNIGLSTFPYNTTLTIYNPNGSIFRQYQLVGNPDIV